MIYFVLKWFIAGYYFILLGSVIIRFIQIKYGGNDIWRISQLH